MGSASSFPTSSHLAYDCWLEGDVKTAPARIAAWLSLKMSGVPAEMDALYPWDWVLGSIPIAALSDNNVDSTLARLDAYDETLPDAMSWHRASQLLSMADTHRLHKINQWNLSNPADFSQRLSVWDNVYALRYQDKAVLLGQVLLHELDALEPELRKRRTPEKGVKCRLDLPSMINERADLRIALNRHEELASTVHHVAQHSRLSYLLSIQRDTVLATLAQYPVKNPDRLITDKAKLHFWSGKNTIQKLTMVSDVMHLPAPWRSVYVMESWSGYRALPPAMKELCGTLLLRPSPVRNGLIDVEDGLASLVKLVKPILATNPALLEQGGKNAVLARLLVCVAELKDAYQKTGNSVGWYRPSRAGLHLETASQYANQLHYEVMKGVYHRQKVLIPVADVESIKNKRPRL